MLQDVQVVLLSKAAADVFSSCFSALIPHFAADCFLREKKFFFLLLLWLCFFLLL